MLASDRQDCARQYASDLFIQSYGTTNRDKDTLPTHGGNIHAFMKEFPQCKTAYEPNEKQLFQDAAAYARGESRSYRPAQPGPIKRAMSAVEEASLAALFYLAGWVIEPQNKNSQHEWAYCTGLSLQVAGVALLLDLIKEEVNLIREVPARRQQWKAIAGKIVSEQIKYEIAHGQ